MSEKIIRRGGFVIHIHDNAVVLQAKKRRKEYPMPARDALPRPLGRYRCVGDRMRIPS